MQLLAITTNKWPTRTTTIYMSSYPNSVPLHPHASKKFHNIRTTDLSSCFKIAKRQFIDTFCLLIEYSSTNIDEQVNSLISNYQELISYENESSLFEQQIRSLKEDYKSLSDQCQPVDLTTWDLYRTNELPTPPKLSAMFADLTQNEQQREIQPENITTDDKILKALPYIWKDPTCVIPDQQFSLTSDEDDLHIQGGKIELLCPITCKPFENPMMSKKCSHVFDKDGITNYFQGYTSRDCPQGACSQKLTLRDFIPDELMKLRCKIAHIKEKSSKKSENLEHLDTI